MTNHHHVREFCPKSITKQLELESPWPEDSCGGLACENRARKGGELELSLLMQFSDELRVKTCRVQDRFSLGITQDNFRYTSLLCMLDSI